MTEEMVAILEQLASLHNAHLATPRPPKWKTWELGPWQLEHDYGALWTPSAWFAPPGRLLDGAEAKRFQRAAVKLVAMGLLEDLTGSRKLVRLKLTPNGHKAVAELTAAPAEVAA